jgi:ribosomal protein S27AE
MSRDCPECGDPLIKATLENDREGFTCIQCGYSATKEKAPEPTGSPLDVDTYGGQVEIRVPSPKRGVDSRPVRIDPDAARRLAEHIEVAADDAERRGEEHGF